MTLFEIIAELKYAHHPVSTNLGKCLAEHKTTASAFVKIVLIMLASFVIAGLLFTISITNGPGETGGRVVLFVLGLLALAPGLLCIYGLKRGWNNGLRFHERGIVFHKAGRDTAIAWDDVAAYTDGAFLSIVTTGELAIEFGMDGLRAGDEVWSSVREEVVVKRALPRLRNAIEKGNSVTIEGATLDAKGITLHDGDRQIPWTRITKCGVVREAVGTTGRVPIDRTFVVIESSDGKLQIEIGQASDREALIALCKERMSA